MSNHRTRSQDRHDVSKLQGVIILLWSSSGWPILSVHSIVEAIQQVVLIYSIGNVIIDKRCLMECENALRRHALIDYREVQHTGALS